MTPEDQALLAQIMFGGGIGQMQAPRPTGPMLTSSPIDGQAMPPQPLMPSRMWALPTREMYPVPAGSFETIPVKADRPGVPYGGPDMPPLARGSTGYVPPQAAPMEPLTTGSIGPNGPVYSGVSPAQPRGAGPALGGLFADREEIMARLGDMMAGWAMGAGGSWQDSIAAGGKSMQIGKVTRAEEKKAGKSLNATVELARRKGIDDATIAAFGGDGKALLAYVIEASQGGKADPVVVGEKLVDRNTGKVIGDYGSTTADPGYEMVSTEEARILGLDPSRPYQRNTKNGKIETVGSSGTTIQVGSKLTESQSKDVSFIHRGKAAFDNMAKNFSVLADPINAYGGRLPGGNFLKTPEYRRAEQAAREVLAVILRKDTGAAITDQEMSIYGSTFLPQPGDDAGTIRQKLEAAKGAIDAMYTGLGAIGPEYVPGYSVGLSSAPAQAAPATGGPRVIDGYTIEEIR